MYEEKKLLVKAKYENMEEENKYWLPRVKRKCMLCKGKERGSKNEKNSEGNCEEKDS